MSGRFVHEPESEPVLTPHSCDRPPVYEWIPRHEPLWTRRRLLSLGTLWRCDCGRLWIVTGAGWRPAGWRLRWRWRKCGWPLTRP